MILNMLKHTKKIKEMYEDIQRRIFYMIPEKWDKMYLYAAVSDLIDGHKTGELFFYYITSFYSYEEKILKKFCTRSATIPYNFFEFHLSV